MDRQRVTILKGANIGDNVVIGACSLVPGKDFGSDVVIAGNPAKVAKQDINWRKERL